MQTGQRVAALGMAVSAGLALMKIVAGLAGHSTAVLADGFESASDVLASGFVLLALTLAAIPPDKNHPYGHGRVETLTGLLIGMLLTVGGAIIAFTSVQHLGTPRMPPSAFVIYPLIASLFVKASLAAYKFRYGRRLKSDALLADAWNDTMDSFSAFVALIAVGLTLSNPARFGNADRFGGFIVGLFVITTGIRIAYETGMQLMDTMPDEGLMVQVRDVAAGESGVRGVEKCFARKTGLKYHVDLHLEVDPDLTVRQSHDIAHRVRLRILDRLDWVADVLVHVEPAP